MRYTKPTMKSIILTFLIVPLILTNCFAQETERKSETVTDLNAFDNFSLVKYDELKFSSAFEESVFRNFFENHSMDYFGLYLCADSMVTSQDAATYRNLLNEKVRSYDNSYFREMNVKKKITRIYSEIHKDMLDKYVISLPFSSVFTKKEYNCVSSSILYSLVFSELEIPFEIREMPDHVYLIAYPGTEHIIVETTDPLHGALVFDNTFKAKYVDYLREAKLISKEEYYAKATDVLFNEYFNRTDSVPPEALASFQYRNMMIKCLEERRYAAACKLQEKAWILYPDATHTYFLLNDWLLYYTSLSKNDLNAIVTLGKLSRFLTKGVAQDVIIGEFAQITQRQLIYDGNEMLYDSSYHIFMHYINDTSLRNEISFLYNYERGRILYNRMDYADALPFTKTAYALKPKNEDARNNFVLAFINDVENKLPDERLSLINQMSEQLPELLEDNLFSQFRLSTYLELIDNSYYNKQISAGESYMHEFEIIYPERNIKFHLIDADIERAYGTAASYYFKSGQSAKSKAVLEKGLSYVPNSYPLRNRLNAVK
jgi:hypothetical protein